MKSKLFLALTALTLAFSLQPSAFGQGTAFTYQGRLNDGANPANGFFDFTFSLQADNNGAAPVGATLTRLAVPVTNGLFNVVLDFSDPNSFTGASRWLEIGVRTNGGGAFTTLSTRQALTAAPYAIRAANVSGTVGAGQLSGTVSDARLSPNVALRTSENAFEGNQTISGNLGIGLAVPDYALDVLQSQAVGRFTTTDSANGAVLSLRNIAAAPTYLGAINFENGGGTPGQIGYLANEQMTFRVGGAERMNLSASGLMVNGPISGDGSQLVNVNGSFKWSVVTADQQAIPNQGYIVNSSSQLAITLPANPQVGDVVRIAGAGSGGWRLIKNSGQTISPDWTARESSWHWISVASSADGKKLAAAAALGPIFTSTDSGLTWTARENNRNWRSIASSSDGTTLVAVVSGGQIYTSGDSGLTWAARESNRNWSSVASSAVGMNLVAVVDGGFIYASTDRGLTWTASESSRSWVSVASSGGPNLVAAAWSGQLYTSADWGVTWTARESNRNWQSVASSSDGTKLVAVVSSGQIYTSADSGVTWTARESNRNWRSVASSSDGTKLVAVVEGGQIYTSADSGVTWAARESNRNWRSVATSADGSRSVAVVAGGQIFTSAILISGNQGSFIELVNIGGGEFFVVNQR